MHSKLIGKDSVNIFFNNNYAMIEDTCASMIRFGHMDTARNHFVGKFKDVSKSNPFLVLGTGNYTKDGLKDGEFDLHYIDGKPEARGAFKNDLYEGPWVVYYSNGQIACKVSFKKGHYDGKCEFYFENGQPYLFVRVSGYRCEISDLWLKSGKKIIDKGDGYCSVISGPLRWYGKIHKGVPDSIWSYSLLVENRTAPTQIEKSGDITISEVSSEHTEEVFGNESFRDGRFIKGQNRAERVDNTYTDNSRITFLPKLPELRVFNCDRVSVANISCDGTDYVRKYHVWRVFYFN